MTPNKIFIILIAIMVVIPPYKAYLQCLNCIYKDIDYSYFDAKFIYYVVKCFFLLFITLIISTIHIKTWHHLFYMICIWISALSFSSFTTSWINQISKPNYQWAKYRTIHAICNIITLIFPTSIFLYFITTLS